MTHQPNHPDAIPHIPQAVRDQTPCDHCAHPKRDHYHEPKPSDPSDVWQGCVICNSGYNDGIIKRKCPGFHAGTVNVGEYDPSLPIVEPDSEPNKQPPVLHANILLHTDEFRGDHSAEVTIALDYKPNETVEELILRAGGQKKDGVLAATDHIEIKVVQ